MKEKLYFSCVLRCFICYLNCSFPQRDCCHCQLYKYFFCSSLRQILDIYLCLISDSVANMILHPSCMYVIRTLGIRNWMLSIRKNQFFFVILFVWIFTLSCVFGMLLNGYARTIYFFIDVYCVQILRYDEKTW